MPVLTVEDLSVNYEKTPVLWDLNFSIEPGRLVAIVGPNGAGKSTLLKTLMGLIKPISGRVRFFQKPLSSVRQKIAYVPQRGSVDWDFPITVMELVLMGRYGKMGICRRPRKADKAAAEHYLDLVEMKDFSHRQISQLSGGQQQRVFLARALIQDADLYFLDEPLAGVDHSTERIIISVLRKLCQSGKTVFVVHHDLSSVEEIYDMVLLLNMHIVALGPVQEVFTAENLAQTYGKNYALFDEALKLSVKKSEGRVS